MRALLDRYRSDPRAAALAQALAEDRDLVLGACQGAAAAVFIAAALAQAGPRRLIVTGSPQALRDDLEELGIPAVVLPELDRFESEGDEPSEGERAAQARRMAALEAFANGSVLVAEPSAADQGVPDLAELARRSIIVKPGQERPIQALVDELVEAGYRVSPVVEARGELAVRGGLVDVFPFAGTDPLRIEFFGDAVESIRRFDAFSQESISRADEAVLAVASGGLAVQRLWDQLPPGPVLVVADVPLRTRLPKDHGRREVRLSRHLDAGALDGATLAVDRLRGDLRRGLAELGAVVRELGESAEVVLLARSEEAVRELSAHLDDAGLGGEATVAVGRLSAGFRDQEHGLLLVHDYELAERAPVRRRGTRIAGGAPLSSLADLRRGDLVVHLTHGIACFQGMATLEKRGFLEDFLLLEFAGGTKLYVPVEAIDLVQKFVGATGRKPELSTIGGGAWAKRKARAEKAIADMSAELLATQVARITAGGIPVPADTPEVRRFEAAFPWEETEDQLAATREIKADLERPVAMDRLLCGDVGFGKTEVAMRAACKVATAGLQVAVLAPTTLLAEQHLETFSERFQGLPITVAGLNRFRSPAERRAVLEKAASGAIDVLVGTHALLTDELRFARLGLLVIDEEHRFGVKQKERLRALIRRAPASPAPGTGDPAVPVPAASAAVTSPPPHVLSLSATPIPRTLHFSLLGLRDISVLAEAPAERLAVETRVAPWDAELVQHALQRELDRQGQAFVIHNRIEDLDRIAWDLRKLIPALRLEAVHGQMDEERIAKAMDAFRHGGLDCLISTSIVESGIDIPNANTLIVTDAQRFGLAELHQLRGRIGRYNRQAYAYFLTPPHRELGEEARERLAAIQEYADLGAGFKLAMRDLELRGAGNLLGGEQSGHIDAIGYELYTKLLSEAVARAKGEAAAPGEAGTTRTPAPAGATLSAQTGQILSLTMDAYIPDSWLETPQLKFELHKAIDGARRISDLARQARSSRDRFGALPDAVVRLFLLKAVRLRARELGLARIEVQDRAFRLHLGGAMPKELAAAKLPELVHVQPDGKVLVLFMRPRLEPDVALDLLTRLLGIDTAWLGRTAAATA